jgi:uncharacterized membrane protein
MKTTALYLLIGAYIFAGSYHFINPSFYQPFFPPYLQKWSNTLNILAGIAEIALAVCMIFSSTRNLAAYGLMAMLIAFIPAHIYMIQKGNFTLGNFNVTPLISWLRLLVLHPLLLLWVWWVRK